VQRFLLQTHHAGSGVWSPGGAEYLQSGPWNPQQGYVGTDCAKVWWQPGLASLEDTLRLDL